MKLDQFILYSYLSVMLPILVFMLIGMVILLVSKYLEQKEDEKLKLEDFTYRLSNKTDKELTSLLTRYTSYLTDPYLKTSSPKWNKYINAIETHINKRELQCQTTNSTQKN